MGPGVGSVDTVPEDAVLVGVVDGLRDMLVDVGTGSCAMAAVAANSHSTKMLVRGIMVYVRGSSGEM